MNADERPWLATKVYAPKRQRTVNLVRRAVNDLVVHREKVSLATVSRRSRELDPEKKGVSESAILGNAEARSCYEQHRTARRSGRRTETAARVTSPNPSRIDPGRNLPAARARYMRMPKAEVVDRLIMVEQAYATERRTWLTAIGTELAARQAAAPPREHDG